VVIGLLKGQGRIGIDVEDVRKGFSQAAMEYSFTPKEKEALGRTPNFAMAIRHFSLKEAVYKALSSDQERPASLADLEVSEKPRTMNIPRYQATEYAVTTPIFQGDVWVREWTHSHFIFHAAHL
jgi:phosphopantetheine--protein transferase-like protein